MTPFFGGGGVPACCECEWECVDSADAAGARVVERWAPRRGWLGEVHAEEEVVPRRGARGGGAGRAG